MEAPEIVSFNVHDLDVAELEQRLELAHGMPLPDDWGCPSVCSVNCGEVCTVQCGVVCHEHCGAVLP